MSDHKALVRELRETAQTRDGAFVQANLYITAADRIEQLERELADWKAAAADADLDRNAAVAARERAEAALRELVRLKDLKDEITDYGATPGWEQTPWSANQREYVRCKPAAWEAARALVKEQPHGQ
jgi:hypothetical protein